MATTKNYRDFLLEQMNLLENIVCRPMMGEYLLYYNNVLFGGIYDDRLLVKIVEKNKKIINSVNICKYKKHFRSCNRRIFKLFVSLHSNKK